MSYIEDGGFFSPICKHFIDLEDIREATWLQCECGNWFNYSLLVDLESAKSRLEVAQDDVRFLQGEVARVSKVGAAAGVKRFIKAVAQSFRAAEGGPALAPSATSGASSAASQANNERVLAPAAATATYNAPATTTAMPSIPTPAAKAPVQPPVAAKPRVPERPRALAKSENRRQIGLFITSITMVMVALISYIIWGAQNGLDETIQVPIVAVVVIGLGFVAVRTKRLSHVLSNVLAVMSSVLALVALYFLSAYKVFGAQEAWTKSGEWQNYAYVALIPLILALLTIYPGYRFKIAAWLNPTAVLFAVAGTLFSLTYLQNAFFANTEKLSLGWQLITPTITAVLVIVAGRLSRSKLEALPDEAGVAKLVDASEDDRRAYYELVDRHREQASLGRVNRLSLVGILTVMAVHLVSNLIGLAENESFDGFGLITLGLVWLVLAPTIEKIGGTFTASGTVASSVKRGSWIIALGSLGLGASSVTLEAGSFSTDNIVISGILWLLGSALVFAPNTVRWVRANSNFAFAANLTALLVWASWFVYALANGALNSPQAFIAASTFAVFIAVTLIIHNFTFKIAKHQLAASVAIVLGALMVFGGSRVDGGLASPTTSAIALLVALFLINGFTVANAFINSRASVAASPVVRTINIVASIAAVIAAIPTVLGSATNADGSLVSAGSFWPVLMVLILFAAGLLVVPNLSFATKDDSILTPETGRTLVGQSVLYMGAGFIYLITLANNPNVFFTVAGYTFAVMAVVLSYGVIRRAVWAITTSYGLSTIFSIAIGEAAVLYQNAGHEGNTINWAVWFLVPFAVLTYVHLAIMRVRAEASTGFKVLLGVGGFGLTALVFEVTRAVNASLNPASLASDERLADYVLNQNVNVATLLGLGALVLLLRLAPAVRKDDARDQVLNFSGLIALALALVDTATTTPTGIDSLTTRIALLCVTALLLVNSRNSFARSQTIAALFVGQGLIYNLAGWVSADTDWLKSFDKTQVAVIGPYLIFMLVLAWFALVRKLSVKADVGRLANSITLGLTGLITAVQIASVQVFDAPNYSLAYAATTLALLFAWRWIARKSALHIGVLGAGTIVWAAGAFSTFGSSDGMVPYSLYAAAFAVPAALLLIDSLVTRKAISTFIGLAPLMATSWFFAATMIREYHIEWVALQLVVPAVAFALATLVLVRIKALESARFWFATVAPIALLSGIAEVTAATALVQVNKGQDWGALHNSIDWPATLVVALLLLALTHLIANKLSSVAKTSTLIGSAVLWITGLLLILVTQDHTWVDMGVYTDYSVARTGESLIYVVVSVVVWFWHSIAAKSRTTLVLAAAGSAVSGVLVDVMVHDWYLNWFAGPEVGALVTAIGFGFCAFAYGKVVGPAKSTLLTWGIPTATLLLPSVFYTFASNQIAQPWNELDVAGVIRLVGLALIGTLVMLIGMRAGNKGLVYASVATLLLEFVPALWNAIGNLFGGSGYANELRGLLIAVTFVVLQTIFKRVISLKINSLAVWGIPAVITLAPALVDVWAALGHDVEANDWVRFVVLVGVSTGFLVVGAIRRVSGLFYPGFIGVITAVLPYAFASGGGLGIVGALVVLAALIIWVAVRIDKFTGWLKELK